MYQLYYAEGSASMGIRVLLEESGAPYEVRPTTIEMDKPRPSSQREINPNGWVPVLVWGDRAMYEAAAITIFLGDQHPEAGLAPTFNDAGRELYLQTLVYFSSSVQNAFQLTYYPGRFADTPETLSSAEKRGVRRLRETWGVVEQQVTGNTWVLGDRFSAADVYLFMLTTWLKSEKNHPQVGEFPNVKRIAEAAEQRSSIAKVYLT